MDNFENRLKAIEYELSQIAESEYLEELKKKFSGELKSDVIVNIIPTKDISFKTRSLLSAILDRLELTRQDRLDLEKYIIFGGGDNIEYIKQTLAYLVNTINNKAEINKYYPNMSVGFADDLVGRGESVPAEFSFRASGGKSINDGTAWVKRLRGNSVVWNQHLEKKYLSSGSNNIITDGGIPKGHKFAIIRSVADNECYYIPSEGIYYYALAPGEDAKIMTNNHDVDTSYVRAYSVGESGYVQIIDLTQMFQAGNEPTTIEEYYARKPIVEDEFAYNEGEVIHMTAEGIKSVGDNAWDEEWENGRFNTTDGSNVADDNTMRMKNAIKVLPNATYYCNSPVDTWMFFLDNDGKVIEGYSTGLEKYQNACRVNNSPFTTPRNAAYIKAYFNQYLSSVTTYNHDIMISLVHSGWKQDTDAGYQPYWEDKLIFDERIKEHFPDGMKKWDIVYNKNGKGHVSKGMRVVDLGTLDWSYSRGVFITYLTDMRGLVGQNTAILAKYSASSSIYGEEMYDNVEDKVYKTNGGATGGAASLAISDSSYTDAASFKAAMAGVLLYYELAEPTIIEYDEPFNLDYRVADFGTEQAITEQPSAPISVDIIYQFNAVDMIREHELKIAELQSIIATMQEQLVNLTSK